MLPSFFMKVVIFLLIVFFVVCENKSKRNPAPSIGPVKYEIIGKYLGYILPGISTRSVSGNRIIVLTYFPFLMELDCSGNVRKLLLPGYSPMT